MTNTNNKPTHNVYFTDKNDKGSYTDLGSLFPSKFGFNLALKREFKTDSGKVYPGVKLITIEYTDGTVKTVSAETHFGNVSTPRDKGATGATFSEDAFNSDDAPF